MSGDRLTQILWRAAELRTGSCDALSTWAVEVAKADIPWLVREVERLRAENVRLTAVLRREEAGGE